MGIEYAYREIDRSLLERGAIHTSYVLWGAVRAKALVIDFAVPLTSPNRTETLAAIESVLGRDRGRDRISDYAMELARFVLDHERRGRSYREAGTLERFGNPPAR